MLRGEGWVVAGLSESRAVERAHSMDLAMPSLVDLVPQPWPPPTLCTNKFTYGYQEFVNTYPRYREANPALFSLPTFPFLFGVMYGISVTVYFYSALVSLLLWDEKANDNSKLGEMTEGLHARRYMILQ
jgi:V-type H+-transporting ATPase subunit a